MCAFKLELTTKKKRKKPTSWSKRNERRERIGLVLFNTYQRLLLPGVDVLSLGFRKMIPNLLVTGGIEHFFNLIDWSWSEVENNNSNNNDRDLIWVFFFYASGVWFWLLLEFCWLLEGIGESLEDGIEIYRNLEYSKCSIIYYVQRASHRLFEPLFFF